MRKKTILNSYLKVLLIACCSLGMPALLLANSTERASVSGVTQQSVTISGTIKDEAGMELTGVNIVEKGTTNGTMSDLDGKFQLTVSPTSVLVFTYVGYIPQEVSVSGKNVIQVVLREDSRLMDDVVVIGYGTQRKGDITSAVASVKPEDFNPGNVQDAAELIKGKVAGLTVMKGTGDPNTESQIMLRGVSSLEGTATPLILIDGIQGDLSTVAPENIESIDVLKDASAAAIYGTRGANGVIIITTKSGRREQSVQTNYNGYVSISNFSKHADFLKADDIRRLIDSGLQLKNFTNEGATTDWVDLVTRTGFTHNHNVNMSGGTKTTTYAADLTYRKEEGVINRTNSEDIKMSFDLTQYILKDIVKLNANMIKTLHKNSVTDANEKDQRNVYRQAVIRNPTSPVYNEDGTYNETFGKYLYYNPVALINEKDGEYRKEITRLTANLTIEPIKGWQTNLMTATKRETVQTGYFHTWDHYSNTSNGRKGEAYRYDAYTKSDYLELTSKYDMSKNGHRLSVLAGYSYEKNTYENGSSYNWNFPSEFFSYHNMGTGKGIKEGTGSVSSFKNMNSLIGFFGRVSYGYDNRYNVLVSLRHEGSSKFGENNKWGTFPSVSAGWTISNEEFMESYTWLDMLKIRAGYGVTGVIPKESYQSLTRYDYGTYYMDNGEWTSGLSSISNPNPDLKWEKSGEFNAGIDFSVFGDRFGGSIDYYYKKTSDMLWWYSVPTPPNIYNQTLANVGEMRNTGVEILLNVVPVRTKDFEWKTTITLSHNSNKLLNLSNDLYQTENYLNTGYLGEPITLPTHRLEVGKSLGNYWGMKSVGISEKGLWLIEDPKTGEAVEFSAGLLNDEYRQYLGNGLPKVFLGWNHTFRYKEFDLGFQMSGQFGFKILNEQRAFYENKSIAYNNLSSAYDLHYGKDLSDAQSQTFVSYHLEKGDFLKMDNITLGYNWNLRNDYIKRARFYISGENLFTITSYSGLDPELTNDNWESFGNDPRDKYPSIRSFTFGVNLTF